MQLKAADCIASSVLIKVSRADVGLVNDECGFIQDVSITSLSHNARRFIIEFVGQNVCGKGKGLNCMLQSMFLALQRVECPGQE